MARPFLVVSVDFDGSIFVIMMARRVGFATLTSEFVSICFRFAVRRLRGFCWASIVCEPCLLNSEPTYPLLITLVLR